MDCYYYLCGMNHLILIDHKTHIAHNRGRKWLLVEVAYHEGEMYLYTRGQKCYPGTICYFEKENKIRPLREVEMETPHMVVAFPDEIGWIFNEGPPHDHNFDYTNGHYLEVIHPDFVKTQLNNNNLIHIELEIYFETGFEGPLPYSPQYYKNKVIIDVKTEADFLKDSLIDMSLMGIKVRKETRSKIEKLAEEMWDIIGNEGDDNERSYWIRGFMSGFNFGKD